MAELAVDGGGAAGECSKEVRWRGKKGSWMVFEHGEDAEEGLQPRGG